MHTVTVIISGDNTRNVAGGFLRLLERDPKTALDIESPIHDVISEVDFESSTALIKVEII